MRVLTTIAKQASGDGIYISFAGWSGWLLADEEEVRVKLRDAYSRYITEPRGEVDSGILVQSLGLELPCIRIISRGIPVAFSKVLENPESKRFALISHSTRQMYVDTIQGREPALEVRENDILILQPDRLALYVFHMATWLMLSECPLIALHAAVVAVDSSVVALIGPSRSGKSTLSWALQRQGAHYYSDDWVFFSLPDYHIHAGYNDLCMRPGGVVALDESPSVMTWYESKPNDMKCKIELPEAPRQCPSEQVHLIFLDGFASNPSLAPIGAGEAIRRVHRGLSYGDPSAAARLEAAAGLIDRHRRAALAVGTPAETAEALMDYVRRQA